MMIFILLMSLRLAEITRRAFGCWRIVGIIENDKFIFVNASVAKLDNAVSLGLEKRETRAVTSACRLSINASPRRVCACAYGRCISCARDRRRYLCRTRYAVEKMYRALARIEPVAVGNVSTTRPHRSIDSEDLGFLRARGRGLMIQRAFRGIDRQCSARGAVMPFS
jgi:hypothetical protein